MESNAPIVAAPGSSDTGERGAPRQLALQGKENLTVSISADVLQEARRLKGQIQISQVVEQALMEKIREIHEPEKTAILKRLRYERDERKGTVFAVGFAEGQKWAAGVASWVEIKQYSRLRSADV